jgi:hypothetical protein
MARIRSIDPAIFKHRKLARASLEVQHLFWGLVCVMADDEGRWPWDPELIATEAFPFYRKATPEKIAGWLVELEKMGLILRYSPNGEEFGFLCGWFEHQYIQRPSPSSLPAPPVEIESWEAVIELTIILRGEKGRADAALRQFEQLVDEDKFIILSILHGAGTLAERSVNVPLSFRSRSPSRAGALPVPSSLSIKPLPEEITTEEESESPKPAKKPSKKSAAAEAQAQKAAEYQELLGTFSTAEQAGIDDYMAMVLTHTPGMSIPGRLTRLKAMRAFMEEENVSGADLAYGLAEAIGAKHGIGIDAPNYYKKAARGNRDAPKRLVDPGFGAHFTPPDPPQSRENAAISAIIAGRREPPHE